jgi:D-ala D-ala ligase C-terminus
MERLAILYEHPHWFKPLFAELDRRGVPHDALDATSHTWDPDAIDIPYALVVNRMSPSAWTRGHGSAVFHTLHYLAHLDAVGANVVNGYDAFAVELSKARQCSLFALLGLRHPRTRVIADAGHAGDAARDLRFPVLVKPNVGGSGAGIRSFETREELADAARRHELELGPDSTALVQEQIPAADEEIVRIEILGGRFLYAIRIRLVPGGFNLCPADYCELPGVADGVSGRGLPIEAFDPPPDVIDDAARIAAAARMDVAGVEYVVDARDGAPTFYDVNALSNFVADAPDVVGFDPFVDLVDFLVARAGLVASAA